MYIHLGRKSIYFEPRGVTKNFLLKTKTLLKSVCIQCFYHVSQGHVESGSKGIQIVERLRTM